LLKTSGERKNLVPTCGFELSLGWRGPTWLNDIGLRQLPVRQASVRFIVALLQLAGDTNRLFHTHNTHDADIVG
jgi:hypothetical protein